MKTVKSLILAISLLFLPTAVHAAMLGDIVTLAGGGAGDHGAATLASLNSPISVAVDGSGNLYIADRYNHRIRKVASGTGIITTVAGNGNYGFSGDNGPATSACLYWPSGVTVDSSGNLYIVDQSNHRIRKVASGTGIITTVAGNGLQGFSGDDGAATSASLNSPSRVAVDSDGNLYVADASNSRVRKVASGTGIITTVAGNGIYGFSGDGGLATSASLRLPSDVTVDSSGNLYIVDSSYNRIFKVASGTGIITTVAGNGTQGFSGDGGVATSAAMNNPYGITFDSSGNLYFCDANNNRIRKVESGSGIITTVAGNGMRGFGGDNGAATFASLDFPSDLVVDSSGNLFIVDTYNYRIRKVASGTGTITTVAGNGTASYGGDNSPGVFASFNRPRGVAVDSNGNVYVADHSNDRIRKMAGDTGIITTVAGNGAGTYAGDNGPANSASLYSPSDVAFDKSGNMFIADTTNHLIRRVDSGTGIITTVAGTNIPGFSGDNGSATSANLYWPSAVTVDGSGNLYIADYGNHRIRKVASETGIITTIAGGGTEGYGGDNGAATAASLHAPNDLVIDSSGRLYIADYFNNRIRMVDTGTGIITTVAGDGNAGFSGDNVAATSTSLRYPSGIALDSSGNLYIADNWNNRIRKVASGTGIITTVAGDGTVLPGGDVNAATSPFVSYPSGLALDNNGNLYFTDGYDTLRKLYLNPVPTVTALHSSAVDDISVIGGAVTFTATVTSSEKIPANTTITFKDGAASIGSALLDATGTATFTTSSLAVGSHSITASYPANGILAGSTSPALVHKVVASTTRLNLSMILLGTGGGSLNSSPTGIACASGSSSGCVQAFAHGTSITLTATPDWKSSFTGWGPPCNGTGNCLITLNSDAEVSATFSAVPRIKLPGPKYFGSLQDAYENASEGDTLSAIIYSFTENLQMDLPLKITLKGGMSSDFLTQHSYTVLRGSLTVARGTLIVDRLVVR